jgi:protein ImuB
MLTELLPQAVEAPPERDDALLERPSRLLAEPSALDGETDGRGELISGRVLGRKRRVMALSGPERLGGDWWAPTAFSRDYYRVIFEGVGPTWVFRDGRDGRFYLQGFFD